MSHLNLYASLQKRFVPAFLAAAALCLPTAAAAAIEVRPAPESEIASALLGCWKQERTFEQNRREERLTNIPLHIPLSVSVCFEAEGAIFVGWVSDNDGGDGGGTFALEAGKLRLFWSELGHWPFDVRRLECDVIMNPGRAMKLLNCAGLGADAGAVVTDSSYEFDHD